MELPILNLNTLDSQDESVKMDKDTVNLTSVTIATEMIDAILFGFVNPLEFAVKRKLVVDALDMVMKHPRVKSYMIDEIDKFGKQGASALGAKISIRTMATYKYDQDSTWRFLKQNMEPFEKALKDQEEKIKLACKGGHDIKDEHDNVIASCVSAPKTDSISVSFNK